MNIFIDNNDLEEQYGEQKYKEYLEKENKQMKQEDNYILCNMAKQELYEMIYKYREEFLFKDEN